MRRSVAAFSLVVGATLAAGCSSGSSGGISAAASKTLQADVQHVREVAAVGTYRDLQAAVAALKRQVEQFQRDGEVSASRAVAIEDAADALLQAASPSPSPTPSPTTTSPTPSPTTTSPTPTPTPTTTTPPTIVPTMTSPSAAKSGNGGQPISIGGSASP